MKHLQISLINKNSKQWKRIDKLIKLPVKHIGEGVITDLGDVVISIESDHRPIYVEIKSQTLPKDSEFVPF